MKALSSALTWAAVALVALAALPVLLVLRLVDRTPGRLRTGRAFRIAGSTITRINPEWTVEVEGLEAADALDHPYVVVSNHQSHADIPVISLLPWEMKWVAKKELFDVPVLGWMMRLADDIAVDRADPASRASVLARAKERLRRGASVMFFAEGTRSKDGRVRRFHDGAFRLAVSAGVPVLPLAIDGTMDALPKHGWQFSRADVRLAVLEPVPTDGLGQDDVEALRDRVRAVILERVAAWREVPAASVDALASPPERSPEALAAAAEAPGRAGEDGAKSGAVEARPARPG